MILQAPVFHSALYNLEPQMINKDTLSACNNAAWCMGECARRCLTLVCTYSMACGRRCSRASASLLLGWTAMLAAHAKPAQPLIPPLYAPLVMTAGELAIKCSSEELKPIALQALERLAMILQVPVPGQRLGCCLLAAPAGSMHGCVPSLSASAHMEACLPACSAAAAGAHWGPAPQLG